MPTPAKTLYRLNEVTAMLDLPASTLRFWEKTFPMFTPDRSPKGQRRYTPEQVEIARRIKELLYDKGMRNESALKYLNATYRKTPPRRAYVCNTPADALRLLGDLKHSLSEDAHALAKVEAITEWINRKSTRRKRNRDNTDAI